MKRILFKLLMTAVFLLLLGFALQNTVGVTVRFLPGFEWQAPLAFVLLVFFALGSGIGVLANFAVMVRLQREILGLKRELRSHPRGGFAATATAETI